VKKPLLIAVVGPTASGKTARAIELALQHQNEIISFDSRQCYKELNIGVAPPSADELQAAPHHFIASHSVHQPISAGQFPAFAWPILHELLQKKETIVAVGGSGLFLKVLLDGIDPLPSDTDVRNEWEQKWQSQGIAFLQSELKKADPAYFNQADVKNPHRVLRALEVITITGKKFSELRTQNKQTLPFDIQYDYLLPQKEILHQRIDDRVEMMMDMGLLQEAEQLLPYRQLQPLNTVGYKELFEFMDGMHTLTEAIELIKTHTRQYAKRQVTWFNKEVQHFQ
jgi:tRNA dimethylallyltransferase